MFQRGVWPGVLRAASPGLGAGLWCHRCSQIAPMWQRVGQSWALSSPVTHAVFCQCISRFQAVQRVKTDQGRQNFTLSKEFQSPFPGCLCGGGPCACWNKELRPW